MSERIVDALGTWCPVPIHLIARAAGRSQPGDVLELLADDPLIEVDLPAWCHTLGQSATGAARGRDLVRRAGQDFLGRSCDGARPSVALDAVQP